MRVVEPLERAQELLDASGQPRAQRQLLEVRHHQGCGPVGEGERSVGVVPRASRAGGAPALEVFAAGDSRYRNLPRGTIRPRHLRQFSVPIDSFQNESSPPPSIRPGTDGIIQP